MKQLTVVCVLSFLLAVSVPFSLSYPSPDEKVESNDIVPVEPKKDVEEIKATPSEPEQGANNESENGASEPGKEVEQPNKEGDQPKKEVDQPNKEVGFNVVLSNFKFYLNLLH